MKSVLTIFFSLLVAVCCATSLSAQTSAVKIAVIDSDLFYDEKTGITRYVNAIKQIDNETKPQQTELQGLAAKVQAGEKEIQQLQEAYQKNPNGPVGPAQIQSKVDEVNQLKRQGSYKQEDLNQLIQKRRQQLLTPIVQDISNALQEYAKQKGYTVIFDLARDNGGFLVAMGDDKLDVTKDFIAFFNSRPAGAGTTQSKPN
jgi:Outer membrane protein